MSRLFGMGGKSKTFEFRCEDCGEIHRGSPSISYDTPIEYFRLSEHERADRADASKDFCRIGPPRDEPDEPTHYFIRAVLEVPILGASEPFTWGVWVTQSESSFKRYVDTYDQDQSGDGSFGWLAVTMPTYVRDPSEPIEYLECNVEWGRPGNRPVVLLKPRDHPLYADQRDGISWDAAIEIARITLHGR